MKLVYFVVTGERREIFRQCVQSLLPYLNELNRLFVVVNGPYKEQEQWLLDLSHPHISWIRIREESRVRARNRAFDVGACDIIYYLDDDVLVDRPLGQIVRSLFASHPTAAIAGGPNLTPKDSSSLEHVFGSVMTSAFAAPFIRRRYSSEERLIVDATERDLILCNLAFRLDKLPRGLRLKEPLRSNEENLFVHVARRSSALAVFSSELAVFHRRRSTWSGFARQIATCGRGRAQQTALAWQSTHLAFFVPSFSLLAGLCLLTLGRYSTLALLLGIHSSLALVSSLCSASLRERGVVAIALSVPATFLVHCSYGWGFALETALSLFHAIPRHAFSPYALAEHR